DLAAPAMLAGDSLDLGRAQLDHGELGRDEEAVEQYQQQGQENQAEIGEVGRGVISGGGVHEGFVRLLIATGWGPDRCFSRAPSCFATKEGGKLLAAFRQGKRKTADERTALAQAAV